MRQYIMAYQLKFRNLRWSTHEHPITARSPDDALVRMEKFLQKNYTEINPGFQYREIRHQ